MDLGMTLRVAGSHAFASFRTGRIRPFLKALAAVSAAIFLAVVLHRRLLNDR